MGLYPASFLLAKERIWLSMDNPLVSIIVPIYNAAIDLVPCL